MLSKTLIYYFHYNSKESTNGLAPIYCRITVNSTPKKFATGLYVQANNWDTVKQKAKGRNEEVQFINFKLACLTKQIKDCERKLIDTLGTFSIEDLYFQLKGGAELTGDTFQKLMKDRLDVMGKLVGTEYSKDTYRKFKDVYNHTINFSKKQYNMSDIPLKKLDYQFIAAFQQYLLTDRKQIPNTVNKTLQKVIEVAKYAVKCGYLEKNPFNAYERLKVGTKSITFLTDEEIEQLENYHFTQHRLEQVKDLYLFSVYTGLAYREAANLCKAHLIKGLDNEIWINMTRQKTGNSMEIPLLPPAQKILSKYITGNEPINKPLLPMISNQRMNSYLKEIAEILGINKRLTTHTARKTFASTILLNNDVPIEIVSKLLGHSSIRVTEAAYAQVMNKNTSRHMNQLKQKLYTEEN